MSEAIDPVVAAVDAAIKAVRAGFTDVGDIISKNGDGRDLEDVLAARKRELDLMRKMGLPFDTDPDKKADGSPADKPEPKPAALPAPADDEEEKPERSLRVAK